jgi:hypothetical protein
MFAKKIETDLTLTDYLDTDEKRSVTRRHESAPPWVDMPRQTLLAS